MFDFTQHVSTRLRRLTTQQREPIPNSTQVPNSASGFAWVVDHWTRLDRFLVLGSEGGTFYIRERPLTRENATSVQACVAEDGRRVVRRVVEISESGRASKNDPALFVLAMAASAEDADTRAAALDALPLVARTGTHLFHWLHYVRAFRGWGRGVRNAVGRWYTRKSPSDLAYQVLKYQTREGWSHRDALRLAHPKAPSFDHELLFRYVVKGWADIAVAGATRSDIGGRLEAMHAIREMSVDDAARVIRVFGLTREMIPTELLTKPEIWEALLDGMPLIALIRNLGVMSKVGLLVPGASAVSTVVARLGDRDVLRRSRVHPLQLLAALKTYTQGRGMKGQGMWSPVSQVVDALDGGFYRSFANAPSTGKRIMLALDVAYPSMWGRLGSGLTPLSISPRQRLDDVVQSIRNVPFGGTDCALPMVEALRHRWEIDTFVVYTDSETWAGDVHPAQALRTYRERTGIAAKVIVVAMTSNGFSIADPNDAGMLDVVGFDSATPNVISDFIG